jgi:hypothetical protein
MSFNTTRIETLENSAQDELRRPMFLVISKYGGPVEKGTTEKSRNGVFSGFCIAIC